MLGALMLWPAFDWMLTAWRESPLDRQGPLFFAMGIAVGIRALLRRGPSRLHWAALAGAVFAYFAGMLLSINALHGCALAAAVWFAMCAVGAERGHVVAVVGLVVLALPVTAFLMGTATNVLGLTGASDGVVHKWPIAGALIAFAIVRPPFSILMLGLVGTSLVSALGFLLLRDVPTPTWTTYWFGLQPLASALALSLSAGSLLLIGWISWKKEPRYHCG